MTSKRPAGFTIVELLVTIALLALAVPALATLINTVSAINDRARDLASIHALVEHKLESLRSISYTGLNNGTTDFTTELPATVATPRNATYTISSHSASVKQIDVSVSYNDHGETRSLTYRTYIGELGVGQY